MILLDEDLLMCDLCETYHITNYKDYTPSFIASLAVGLRNESRIKMKMADITVTQTDMLLASISDRLAILAWQNTKNGAKGLNPPKPILDILLGKNETGKVKGFTSSEDFMRAWNG